MQINLPDKLYYSIGEVARAFDVNASLIRFWEKEFDIIQPKKNRKGNRLFTPTDIKNLKIIYHLVKERGYTLEGARIALEEDQNLEDEIELVFRLEKIKAEILSLKSYFDDVED